MGKKRYGRDIDGILLVDKPTGETSNSVLQKIKRIYHAKKAGHTGSLDPLATGMLPICLGQATKFAQYLLNAEKIYLTTAKLGIITDTGDADGNILIKQCINSTVNPSAISHLLQQFLGTQTQVPPMYSALKHQGQPLYKLARKGIEIPRKSRTITISHLILKSFKDDELELEIHCSKGTYIRSLVSDIGEKLGCGAHVKTLRRLAVSPFKLQAMHPLPTLQEIHGQHEENDVKCLGALDKLLLPVSIAVNHWPAVTLSAENTRSLQYGQVVILPQDQGITDKNWVRITNENNTFIGIGEILEQHRLVPRRLLKTD